MRSLFSPWVSPTNTVIPNLSLITVNLPNHFSVLSQPNFLPIRPLRFPTITRSQLYSNPRSNEEDLNPESPVQELSVPVNWLHPPKALEESEWLRFTLHKWLDDEYCPEPTNVEISKVAAHSYYESLLEKRTDLGEILLKMASELESISFQESFHGAFSSANAAVNLIAQRIEQA
ncbi:hypothetical protein CICLE_v10022531mg [Citrus x clementina]|uniref:Uncharacterized protein n=3 Tax=Citrus TaxID=2706 RepID=A0ACB8MKJ9_CITSI|nr:uncharacterized protein LOC18048161 [Citrus x clementina]ESR57454.1 hypothetical protein CICLE_v10022531mg [Citrus x clementina]KAH9786180.1 hypothetical protein KPL71_010188 [Citrus sinensis]KDO87411.1 hypothetical protein CISIN_1g030631mg [Citrus sinensis]